ncbi:hypothetical protein HMPREF0491_01753, partial [Lachnospiraceae oral taxon 107 str. F0167]
MECKDKNILSNGLSYYYWNI